MWATQRNTKWDLRQHWRSWWISLICEVALRSRSIFGPGAWLQTMLSANISSQQWIIMKQLKSWTCFGDGWSAHQTELTTFVPVMLIWTHLYIQLRTLIRLIAELNWSKGSQVDLFDTALEDSSATLHFMVLFRFSLNMKGKNMKALARSLLSIVLDFSTACNNAQLLTMTITVNNISDSVRKMGGWE